MGNADVASWGRFQEVLTKDNYERWKTLMKTYLLGKKLWAAVGSGSVCTEVDAHGTEDDVSRMSAEALFIIQLSCDSNILDEIRHFTSAKDAWNHLGARYGSELKARADIEQGIVDYNLHDYKDLYKYVEKGDWTKVELLIKGKEAIFQPMASGFTALHVATIAGHVNIVEGLVKIGQRKLVKMKDERGYTALALAAHLTGNTKVAKCMVEMEGEVGKELLEIPLKSEAGTEIPVLLAAVKGHKKMTRYLYAETPETVLNGQMRLLLFKRCIKAEIFDVALKLLQSYSNELFTESLSDLSLVLRALAQMPSAFLSGCQFGLLQQTIYYILRVVKNIQGCCEFASTGRHRTDVAGRFSCRMVLNFLRLIKLLGRSLLQIVYVFVPCFKLIVKNSLIEIREIYEQVCTHYQVEQILGFLRRKVEKFNHAELNEASVYDAMLDAAKHGIVEFIDAMSEANPELLWAIDNRNRGIFSYAVLHRKQNVFQLIRTLNGRKDIIKYRKDMFGNNLLHLAAHLGTSSDLNHRPGAALQMQRELQWFKAVEKVMHPKCKEEINDDHKKPRELFTEKHANLVKAGEGWAKERANSFAIVGGLLITIMFAAAITIPGGNTEGTGVPVFLNKKVFTTFLVADTISLFTSVSSVLIFIGIQTSRFAEKDFLTSLPLKFLFGLGFLCVSMVSMMVAFWAALATIVNKYPTYRWLIIVATILGSFSVMVLLLSQLILIHDIFRSTMSNPMGEIKKKKQYAWNKDMFV